MRTPVLALVVAAAALGGCERDSDPVTNPEAISVESPFHYPLQLWDAGEQGVAVLMVHVTDRGGVDSVYILEPSGHAAFDSAALKGARALKFSPGRRGDRRIAMWTKLPVRFRRDSTPGEPASSLPGESP